MFTELAKLKEDTKAILGGTDSQKKPPFRIGWVIYRVFSYELITVAIFRLASELYQYKKLRFISLFLYFVHKLLFKVDMHPAAKIGGGLQLVHGFSVVIGARSTIGRNVAIFDSVSIGKKNVGCIGGMPIIGDDVIIGTGAKVLGEIVIGENCLIGANSVVLSSFNEKGKTIAGIPARIISEKSLK